MYDFRSIVGFGAQTSDERDSINEYNYPNGQYNKIDELEQDNNNYIIQENSYGKIYLPRISKLFQDEKNRIIITQGMIKFSDEYFRENDINSYVEIELYNFSSPYIKEEQHMKMLFAKYVNQDEVIII